MVQLLAVVLILMGFTVAAIVLAQPALAAIAGTASVSVSRKIARQLLRPPG